jgi:transcriptional regulator GlxA family with amidase domain
MFKPWITRHMKDLDRLKTIQAVIDRDMKPGMAAQRLGMSVRQIERLVVRYRTDGPVGLISRHRLLLARVAQSHQGLDVAL